MKIDKQLLDNLTAQAQASPRLRMNLDLRNSDGAYEPIAAGDILSMYRTFDPMQQFLCGAAR